MAGRADELSDLEERGIDLETIGAKTLLPGLDFYMTAFLDLNHDRPIGMAAGSIPWTAIDRYATRYGLDEDELDVLTHHIRAMDAALREWRDSKEKPGK